MFSYIDNNIPIQNVVTSVVGLSVREGKVEFQVGNSIEIVFHMSAFTLCLQCQNRGQPLC